MVGFGDKIQSKEDVQSKGETVRKLTRIREMNLGWE